MTDIAGGNTFYYLQGANYKDALLDAISLNSGLHGLEKKRRAKVAIEVCFVGRLSN